MAIDTMDKLVAGLASAPAANTLAWHKDNMAATVAGVCTSLWRLNGTPAAGAAEGGVDGAVCTHDTVGGWTFTNPGGGSLSYLAKASCFATAAAYGTLIIFDRLWHNSALDATEIHDTATGASAINRPDNTGVPPNELWMEVYTAIGTAQTLNVHYTNQAGTTDQTATVTTDNNAAAESCKRLNLAAGDTGVRSADSYWFTTTTATAGNFGLVIARRLAEIPLEAQYLTTNLDPFDLGLPQVYDDACLWMVWAPNGTTASRLDGTLKLAQG